MRVRIPSVQRVRPRGGEEYVSLFVQAEDAGSGVSAGVWRVPAAVQELNEALQGARLDAVRLPRQASALFADAQARTDLEHQLQGVWAAAAQAPGDRKLREAVGAFFGLDTDQMERCVAPTPGGAAGGGGGAGDQKPKGKLADFLAKRSAARAILGLVAEAWRGLKKTQGTFLAVAAVVAAVAAWLRRSALRNLAMGGALGMAGSMALTEMKMRKLVQASVESAAQASKAMKKPFSAAEVGADDTDFKVAASAIRAQVEDELMAEAEDAAGATEESKAAAAKEVQELIAKLDEMEDTHKHVEAFKLAEPYLSRPARHQEFEVLWRVSRAAYMASIKLKKEKGEADPHRLRVLQTAVDVAEGLLETHPDESLSHKYYAIAAQENTNHLGTKEKIIGGFTFEKHTKRAIELDPNDATLNYMLGLFCFEVSKLSWAERMGAKAIFGREPPKTSFQEAIACFEKADALKNPSYPSQLEKARCLQHLKKKAEAKAILARLAKLKNQDGDPELQAVIDEAKTML